MQNTNKLNILVVDDEKNHRRAAEILLKVHNLMIVASYDEGREALTSHTDYGKADEIRPTLLEKAGLARNFMPYRENTVASDAEKAKYEDACREAKEQATTHPHFDVVLLDLMMPASRSAQGLDGMSFVGKQMPVGTFLILLALHAGVKNIAMVTDMNHHHHPASAALDPINRSVIKVSDVKIFATNYSSLKTFDEKTGEVLTYKYLESEEGKAKYPQDANYGHVGTFSGKGWDSILKVLLEGNGETP